LLAAAIEETMQVKIFKSTSTDKIEQEVNAWLVGLGEGLAVIKTETSVTERASLNNPSSQTVIVVAVWYDDTGASE
jgi:hypothetical protein